MPCNAGLCYAGCLDRSASGDARDGMKCATGFSDDSTEENADTAGYCVDASVCGATYKGSAGTVVCNAINMVMTAVSALALLTQM